MIFEASDQRVPIKKTTVHYFDAKLDLYAFGTARTGEMGSFFYSSLDYQNRIKKWLTRK